MAKTIVIVCGKHPLISAGGYATYARSLGMLLTQLNYDVHLFCIGGKNKIEESTSGTVHTVASPFVKLLKGQEMVGFPFYSLFIAFAINYIFLRTKYIIIGIGPWSLTGVLLRIFNKRITYFADYFTSIRHEMIGGKEDLSYYSFFEKILYYLSLLTIIPLCQVIEYFILRNSTKIITHYNSTKKILIKEFHVPHKKFVTLPYVAGDKSRTMRYPSRNNHIVCITRQDRRKGIPVLLATLKLLEKEPITFNTTVIGSGPLLNAHKNLAKQLQLKHVKFLGYVTDTSPYLQSASLFVLPSLEEGSSSIALLEAMQAGVAIVATDVDGIPEDITTGISGILVQPNNPISLRNALLTLLTNSSLARTMGRQAKEEYGKKHSIGQTRYAWKAFLNRYFTLLAFGVSK